MSDARPVHVVGPASPLRERVLSELRALEPTVHESATAFLEAAPEAGVVLVTTPVGEGDGGCDALRVATSLGRGRGEWTPALVRTVPGDAGWEVRTLSVGYPEGPDAVRALAGKGDGTVLLELRRTLSEMARSRHDLNNPLTSALAEVQLLLLDVQEGETREALETVQEQLRRIRDLVAATGHLRPRREEEV